MKKLLFKSIWKEIVQKEQKLFETEWEEFPRRFLTYHQGYNKIRPGLHPLFLEEEVIDLIEEQSIEFYRLLSRVVKRIINGDENQNLIHKLGYKPDDQRYLSNYYGDSFLPFSNLFTRIDYLLSTDGLKIMEVNVGSTIGGIGILDRYNELFWNSAMRQKMGLTKRYIETWRVMGDVIKKYYTQHILEDKATPYLVFACWREELDEVHPHEAAYYLALAGYETEVV